MMLCNKYLANKLSSAKLSESSNLILFGFEVLNFEAFDIFTFWFFDFLVFQFFSLLISGLVIHAFFKSINFLYCAMPIRV